MTRRKRNWLIGIGVTTAAVLVGLTVVGYSLADRVEPYVRAMVTSYLESRFDSEVELATLRVRVSPFSPIPALFSRGRGIIASVETDGVLLRHEGRRDLPPMFSMKKVTFQVDLGALFDETKVVRRITVDGMEINVPPKGQRPRLASGTGKKGGPRGEAAGSAQRLRVDEVVITNAALTILPKDGKKVPLHFDIHRLRFDSTGTSAGMRYEASLTNAKPIGEIQSEGTFGPWAADEPGDTPITGTYRFDHADLGIFSGIAGILESSGQFEGSLSSINVRGDAAVPDFRLKAAGHRVPLKTTFEALVDGTNGDTILKPVNGTLGSTKFTTSGGIVKHEADHRRTIRLDLLMPAGNIRDVLALGVKGPPFMQGKIFLKSTIDIPPLSGKVREKLRLNGHFEISNGKFLKSTIQDQIDMLSRRGQGQPANQSIDEVLSAMAGAFTLENEVLTFRTLSFAVPGSGVDLSGTYNLDRDVLDFHGSLKLQATVSQTMTGWKRWVLKPIDGFFSREGSGTFLRIQVVGSSAEPKFGRDRGDKRAEK